MTKPATTPSARTDTLDRMRPAMAALLNVPADRIVPEAHLEDDLGADAIDRLEIALMAETTLGIHMPELFIEATTVAEFIAHIEERVRDHS